MGNTGRKNVLNFSLNNPLPGLGGVASRRIMCVNGLSCDLSRISGPANWGTSKYNALQIQVQKEVGPEGLMLMMAYSWGKAIGSAVAGPHLWERQPIRDWNRNWKADAGPITKYDVRHLCSGSGVYEIPFGRGKAAGSDMSPAADLIVGGWKLGGITTFQSGHFLTPFDSFNNSNAGGSRPNLLSNPNGLSHSSRQP